MTANQYFPSEKDLEQLAWVMLQQFDLLSAKSGMVATHLHANTQEEWRERVTNMWYVDQATWISKMCQEYAAYLVVRKHDANFFSLTDVSVESVRLNLLI